jgi:hypothetical protein
MSGFYEPMWVSGLLKGVSSLKNVAAFKDVTLVCKDRTIGVARTILTENSDFFKNMMKDPKHDTPATIVSLTCSTGESVATFENLV